jgi:hypothetical protein
VGFFVNKINQMKQHTLALLEKALFDSTFFPARLKYPTMDLHVFCDDEGSLNKEEWGIWFDADHRALTRPLDCCLLFHPGEQPDAMANAYAQRLRDVAKKELRGKAMIKTAWQNHPLGPRRGTHSNRDQAYPQGHIRPVPFVKNMLEYSIYGDRKILDDIGVYKMHAFEIRGNWHFIANTGIEQDLRGDEPDKMQEGQYDYQRSTVGAFIGAQFNLEYLWRVVIQFEEDRPWLSLGATKETVKELLSLRTLAEKQRQQRMLHIVGEHRRRATSGQINNVMRHYRGGIEGLWQGCKMKIIPPVNETDSMEKFTDKIMEVRDATKKVQPEKVF